MSYSKNPGNPQAGRIDPNVPSDAGKNPAEQQIRVDGYDQVLQMLRAADPEFRESILRRLAARDRDLVRSLRGELGI